MQHAGTTARRRCDVRRLGDERGRARRTRRTPAQDVRSRFRPAAASQRRREARPCRWRRIGAADAIGFREVAGLDHAHARRAGRTTASRCACPYYLVPRALVARRGEGRRTRSPTVRRSRRPPTVENKSDVTDRGNRGLLRVGSRGRQRPGQVTGGRSRAVGVPVVPAGTRYTGCIVFARQHAGTAGRHAVHAASSRSPWTSIRRTTTATTTRVVGVDHGAIHGRRVQRPDGGVRVQLPQDARGAQRRVLASATATDATAARALLA